MGQRFYSCPNLEFAKGALAGIELVNDSAMKVLGCFMLKTGEFLLQISDEDYAEHEVLDPAGEPARISMEVLREK